MAWNKASHGACLLACCAGLLAGGAAWAVEPKEPGAYLDQKEFFKPELYISSSHARRRGRRSTQLPNRAAWESFLAAPGSRPGEAPRRRPSSIRAPARPPT